MKDTVSVAVVQQDVAWLDPEKNLARMLEFVDSITATRQVDLIVFPELSNTGYVKGWDPGWGVRFIQKAETIPGPATEALGAAAARHGVHIIAGLCEAHPRIPATIYNTAALIGPSGRVLGVHRKVHLAGEEKHYFYRGNAVQAFLTDIGCIGMVICYDTVFPELSRALALQGAEILVSCYTAPKLDPFIPEFLERQAGCRANENKQFVIICNRVGREDEKVFYGRSVVAGPYAEILAQSNGEEEEVLYASLERSIFLRARARTPIFQDRRPELYGLLTEEC